MASAKATRVIVRDWLGYAVIRGKRLIGRDDPPSSSPPAPPSSPSRAVRPARHRSFRAWRRSRPFWGGLLLILAGLELLLIPLSGILLRGQVKLVVYIGIGGVFGLLIGALMVTCGLLLWLTPAHRTFYAIAGALLAMLSFITSNLGGFFLGMLLGITGGSLAFAWTPDSEVAEPVEGPDAGRHRSRLMASTAMPMVLAGALLTGHASLQHVARPSQPQTCILWVVCWPSSDPPPVPLPSLSPGSGSVTIPGIGTTGTGNGTAPGTGSSGTAQPSGLAASTAISVITAGSATLNGLAYQGAAKVPVAGGTQTMMKFTLDSMTLSGDVTATVTENGQTTVTQSSSLSFTGGVTLYATKLSGSLLGIPVTLTPSSVVSLLLQVLKSLTPLVPVTMTNVTTDQPFVLSGGLQAENLVITG